MRRNVDVPKHSKKRTRSKIDPISINMYEVFANGRGRRGMGTRPGIRTLLAIPLPPRRRTAGDREMLSETVVIA